MSKLPNAPLIEIILELRWDVKNKNELSKVQYLYGDIYSELKHKYPYRESIVPPEIPIEVFINQPVHRFRKAINQYPLFQVGPGIITLNTTDKTYFWEEFSKSYDELVDSLLKVFPFGSEEKLTPSILFIDFFPFDFNLDDVYTYISEKFNISYKQSFLENQFLPIDLNIGFFYELPNGKLSITFQKGKNNLFQDGIVLQTRMSGKPISSKRSEVSLWTMEAHDICSDLFKSLTEGELYESFNKKL